MSFSVCLSFSMGPTHDGKNLLPEEQILFYKSGPHFRRVSLPRKHYLEIM